MAIFDRLDRMTSRVVDRANAIPFEFIPMKATPNGRSVPDPSRQVDGLAPRPRGILDESPMYQPIEAGNRNRQGNDFQALVTGSKVELSVDRKSHPFADQVRQGDQVAFDDGRRFEVTSVQRDGLARVVFGLVKIA